MRYMATSLAASRWLHAKLMATDDQDINKNKRKALIFSVLNANIQ